MVLNRELGLAFELVWLLSNLSLCFLCRIWRSVFIYSPKLLFRHEILVVFT